MKLNKVILVALVALLSCFCANALDLPVKKVNGKAYYYYTVQKNEFIYELTVKMGLPRKDILKYNPNAADGLQQGMVLTIPVEYDAVVINGYYTIKYVAGNHETVYGIAKKYGISVDKLIEFNPKAAEGVRGLTLNIPVSKAAASKSVDEKKPVNKEIPEKDDEQPVQAPVKNVENNVPEIEENYKDTVEVIPVNINDGTIKYIIKEGETLESIAAEYELTEFDILKANPHLGISDFTPGVMITIPVAQSLIDSEKRIDQNITPVVSEPQTPDDINIALMLPFALNSENQSKHTQYYTEFYRGFLMGVEKLSHEGAHVNIQAYDSSVSNDSLVGYVNKKQNIIITSDNTAQMALISSQIAKVAPDTKIFNVFAVKDSSNITDPAVIQTNIPRKQMYDKAIQAFINKYEGYTPVFIARIDGTADKADFVAQLKSALDAKGVAYKQIAFRNFLGKDNLEDFNTADSAYVFVPVTGSRTEFKKFAPALKNLKSTALISSNVKLFGYPEWVTFRSDYLDQLHGLDASIYSRFYVSSEDQRAKQIEKDYKNWFGTDIIETVPVQCIVGYDVATFLIKYLRGEVDDDEFEGIQTGFNIIRPDNMKGCINSHLYLINFKPDGEVTKSIIK